MCYRTEVEHNDIQDRSGTQRYTGQKWNTMVDRTEVEHTGNKWNST